jgi:hypothetical protein
MGGGEMSAQAQAVAATSVTVYLPSALANYAVADPVANPFYRHFLQYANRLWLAMGLPGELQIRMQAMVDPTKPGSIEIGGVDQTWVPENPHAFARDLAHSASRVLFACRPLMIEPRLARYLQDLWGLEQWPEGEFLDLLRERCWIRRPVTKEAVTRMTPHNMVHAEECTELLVLVSTAAAENRVKVEEACAGVQEEIFQNRGVVLPLVKAVVDEELREAEFALAWNGYRMVPICGLLADEVAVDGDVERLGIPDLERTPISGPDGFQACWRVRDNGKVAEQGKKTGVTVWTPAEYIAQHLKHDALDNAQALVTVEATEVALEALADLFPALVNSARAQPGFVEKLTAALRRLIVKTGNIRDLKTSVERLLPAMASEESDKEEVVLAPVEEASVVWVRKPSAEVSAEDYADFLADHYGLIRPVNGQA